MCEGDDFFHYTYTDCGTNVTIAVNIFYIEINYGGPSILCWPEGGGDITPIDVGLDNMTISVRPKSSNGINMQGNLDRVKRIWYLSPMRAAKVQASLRIRAVSPEPPLLAHIGSESRGTFK